MSATTRTGAAGAAATKVPMIQLVNSYRLGQLLSVVARLGVADVLERGPLPVEAIAEATGTVAGCLYRVLRALAAIDVFREVESRVFGLTPLAATLRASAPVSLRGAAAMLGCDWHWDTWAELEHSVRTGAPAFDAVRHTTFEAAYEADPEMRSVFDVATEDLENLAAASVRAVYSFEDVGTLVDVESAGGFGGLLFALLDDYPDLHGIFVDKERIVGRAAAAAVEQGLSDRVQCVAWDGAGPLPPGGDLYLLRNVLRDHDDAGALEVLSRCRSAMSAGARLLIVEMVVAPGNELSMGKIIDIDALLFTAHGRERTEPEYRGLLRAAGFAVARVLPTPGPLTLIEAVAAAEQGVVQ